MRKASLLLFLVLILTAGCTTMESEREPLTYAPFIKEQSLPLPVYLKRFLVEKIGEHLQVESFCEADDYLQSDTYLFVSVTIEEGDPADYNLYPRYDFLSRKTVWVHPEGERNKELHLDITFYDGRDLRDFSVYTPVYALHSSTVLSDSQLLLDTEVLVQIHINDLLDSLKEKDL
ncbi:MAG: hypothetical protein PQJ47_06960 [Sphaerochaetaceae bacterium]|nr:hypothetical protein [Sphaerochaetaceae bacterium]